MCHLFIVGVIFFQKELSGRLLSGKLSGGNTVFYFIWDGLYFGQPAPSPY